jgi:uncharacterized protein YggT (Ycf19 family)
MYGVLSIVIQAVEIVFLVQFIMQLVDPTGNHRVLRAIAPLTQPVLTPLRAALPRSQFDYSPLIVVLVFNILRWVFGI